MSTQEFNYKEYLASRDWAILKEQVRERSGGWCERCAVGKYEETHHVTYERIGKELLADLMAVCRPCHAYLSAKSNEDPCKRVMVIAIAVSLDGRGHWGLLPILNARPGVRVIGTAKNVTVNEGWGVSCMPEWTDKQDAFRKKDE